MNIEQIKAAVDAARERINIENRGELLPCPFCHGSAQLVESRGLTKAECARHEYDGKCFVNPETVLATEDEGGVDGCAHIWNYRPAQEQSDAALIALWAAFLEDLKRCDLIEEQESTDAEI